MSVSDAFFKVCLEAKRPSGAYVCLMRKECCYAGPEEGGRWVNDHILEGYQWFDTEEGAEAAKVAVEELARELSVQGRREFGRQCLAELDWADRRGVDADDVFGEVDGPDEWYVFVSEGIPESSYADRSYE